MRGEFVSLLYATLIPWCVDLFMFVILPWSTITHLCAGREDTGVVEFCGNN